MNCDSVYLYRDIINLPRPESAHPHMPRADRAKIFSPFSAVKGYDEAVKNNIKGRINKPRHSPEEQEQINETLSHLERGDRIEVFCFLADPGPDGSGGTADGVCRKVSGRLARVDVPFQTLKVDDICIPFENILNITELS